MYKTYFEYIFFVFPQKIGIRGKSINALYCTKKYILSEQLHLFQHQVSICPTVSILGRFCTLSCLLKSISCPYIWYNKAHTCNQFGLVCISYIVTTHASSSSMLGVCFHPSPFQTSFNLFCFSTLHEGEADMEVKWQVIL